MDHNEYTFSTHYLLGKMAYLVQELGKAPTGDRLAILAGLARETTRDYERYQAGEPLTLARTC